MWGFAFYLGLGVGGGSQLKPRKLWSAKSISFAKAPRLPIGRKSNLDGSSPMLAVRAKYKYAVLALDSCLIKSMSFDVTNQKLEFHAKKWPCCSPVVNLLWWKVYSNGEISSATCFIGVVACSDRYTSMIFGFAFHSFY